MQQYIVSSLEMTMLLVFVLM